RWEYTPELREDRAPRLGRGKVFVSGDSVGWNYSASLLRDQSGNTAIGDEVATDARGVLYDTRIETDRNANTRLQGTLDLSHEALNGAIANIRLLAFQDDRDQREVSDRFGTSLPDRTRIYERTDLIDKFEIGGDYEFGVGPGRLKFIGLHQVQTTSPVETVLTDYRSVRANTGSRIATERENGESILRGEYTLSADRQDWQVSLEGAFNYLDNSGQLYNLVGADYVVVPLPGTDSRVEERRAEASLVHGRALSDRLTAQGSLGVEYSELAQSGANGTTREFVRPKGFVALSWGFLEGWDATFRLERAVGQLDFGDFVTSVGLSSDQQQTDGGNPNLVPEQSWDREIVIN